MVVNLDPYQTQTGLLHLPLEELDITERRPYLAHELLEDNRQIWHGPTRMITLEPERSPAGVFRIQRRLREGDYYL